MASIFCFLSSFSFSYSFQLILLLLLLVFFLLYSFVRASLKTKKKVAFKINSLFDEFYPLPYYFVCVCMCSRFLSKIKLIYQDPSSHQGILIQSTLEDLYSEDFLTPFQYSGHVILTL